MTNYVKDSINEVNYAQCICDSLGHAITNQFCLPCIHLHTWDIGGHIDGCGWPKAFDCAGSYEKLVGGSRMEMHEDMVCTVP